MSKLSQWLLVGVLLLAVWIGLITETLPICCHGKEEMIWAMPIYLLMSFACYSLAVIGYRVATFNDCVEASEELQQQILDARTDLSKKGFKFS